MKRSSKIILAITLLLSVTFWALNYFDVTIILVPYVLIILLIGVHAAYTILSSVFGLKDHP